MSESYGAAMTKQGLALIAKIIADKSSLTLVRVMMGSGQVPEGVYIGDLEDLVEPVVPGTVSEPVHKGSTVEMTVEYRSDMNGGLQEGFIIREFGIFARDGDEEVMILYGNLAERQQYIGPWIEGGGNDVRRYPVSITIAEGTPVILEGLPGTVMTLDDVKDYCVTTLLPQLLSASQKQIVAHNLSEEAHPYLQEKIGAAKAAADAAASAARAAQAAADNAMTAASTSAGGCAMKFTFGSQCAGWNYQITDGGNEVYTGTVPEELVVEVTLKQCSTQYTVTAWDGQGSTWTNQLTTGPYFGPGEVTVTDFAAVLTVKTSPGAEVTAVCGEQSYHAAAGMTGEAELDIGTAGRYTVTASLDGQTASGFIDVIESKGYRLELEAFRDDADTAPSARSHVVFEAEDWKDGQLRIPASEHGIAPTSTACIYTLRQRLGRTALEYDEETAGPVRGAIIAAVSRALNVNASVPGTYPTAGDGHVILTWEQVQYMLLESTSFVDEGATVWNIALVSEAEAAAKAAEEGFDWQDRDNGAEPTVTLDELLTAAYLPALGGVSTAFDAMCTLEALQGLRFRRGIGGEGAAAKYDLDGRFITTWGVMSCQVYWDLDTQDLVVDGPGAFAGDILVMGPAGTGAEPAAQVFSARSVDWADVQNKPDVAVKSDLYPPEHYVLTGIADDPAGIPAQGTFIGEVWKIRSTGVAWAWTGNGWVPLPPGATYTYIGEDFLKEDTALEPESEVPEAES